MNSLFARALALLLFAAANVLHAQVPQLLNYQGRVAVGGVNFNGSGSFKFALVDGTGSTVYWSNDGSLTGSSTGASQPTNAVSLTVTNGLYSVLLGDTSPGVNMLAIPASVFNNSDVRLRVWFNDGSSNGSQLLTPDQRIAAVGYAMAVGSTGAYATTSADGQSFSITTINDVNTNSSRDVNTNSSRNVNLNASNVVSINQKLTVSGNHTHLVGNDSTLQVDGNITAATLNITGAKNFKIDHPLDPANKYLFHSAIESPDVMNLYNGNVTTDANGLATVALPDYFEALNRDFRYQLTVLGQFAQAIVSSKVQHNRLTIQTDRPEVEVSWQVTGIRQDAWMKAHPIAVEQVKPDNERGTYLTPLEYGPPESKGLDWIKRQALINESAHKPAPSSVKKEKTNSATSSSTP
jgi:hypothetical protein